MGKVNTLPLTFGSLQRQSLTPRPGEHYYNRVQPPVIQLCSLQRQSLTPRPGEHYYNRVQPPAIQLCSLYPLPSVCPPPPPPSPREDLAQQVAQYYKKVDDYVPPGAQDAKAIEGTPMSVYILDCMFLA